MTNREPQPGGDNVPEHPFDVDDLDPVDRNEYWKAHPVALIMGVARGDYDSQSNNGLPLWMSFREYRLIVADVIHDMGATISLLDERVTALDTRLSRLEVFP